MLAPLPGEDKVALCRGSLGSRSQRILPLGWHLSNSVLPLCSLGEPQPCPGWWGHPASLCSGRLAWQHTSPLSYLSAESQMLYHTLP